MTTNSVIPDNTRIHDLAPLKDLLKLDIPATVIEAAAEWAHKFPAAAKKAGSHRIARAAEIFAAGHVRSSDDPNLFTIVSQTAARTIYRVDVSKRSCTCPDAAKANICKHRIAVWMHQYLSPLADANAAEIAARAQDLIEGDATTPDELEMIKARLADLRRLLPYTWREAIDAATAYETLGRDYCSGLPVTFERVEMARSWMFKATDHAQALQVELNDLTAQYPNL